MSKDLFGLLDRQYQLKPKVIECDNEIPSGGTIFEFLRGLHITVEPSAAYTQAQNGGAEVSGRIIKNKARAMRSGARFPEYLWVEIYRAAVYLYNRTPRYTFLAHRDGVTVEHRKPYQAHLRVYSCKAFAMTKEAKMQQQKRHRLNPRAWIGFLVGYQSTNIYRIWDPRTGVVVSTRDVIFNEDERFNGDINQLKDDLLYIGRQELIDLLNEVEEPEANHDVMVEEESDGAHVSQQNWESLPGADEELEPGTSWEDPALQVVVRDTGAEQSDGWADHPTITDESSGLTGDADAGTGKPESVAESQAEAGSDAGILSARTRQYATPVSLPPTALLAMTLGGDSADSTEKRKLTFFSRLGPIEAWKAAFAAGRQASVVGTLDGRRIDKAKLHRLLKSPHQLHRRHMPQLPRHHGDLATHPMGGLFQEAEAEHLRSHDEMKSWTEINRLDPRARDQQVLDCMWVYVYKFDEHGRFKKCKARLLVRGDQQLKPIHEETYAATLAG
jgi:hypothetical protein